MTTKESQEQPESALSHVAGEPASPGGWFSFMEKVSDKLSWVSFILMPAMALLVAVDVVLRYVFNAPIIGATDIEGLMFMFVAFCGFGYCWIKGGHIRMELFSSVMSPKLKLWLDAFGAACGVFVFGILAWGTAKETILAKELGSSAPSLKLPYYPFYFFMALLTAVFVLQLLTSIISSIIKAVRS